MRCALVLAVVALAGCGSARPQVHGRVIHGYGIQAVVPRGWSGFVFGAREVGPPQAPTLVETNFPISRIDAWGGETEPRRRGDVRILLLDYGHVLGGFQPASGPVSIASGDFGSFEGIPVGHAVANRTLELGGRDLQLLVEFGSRRPGKRLVARVNAVLASVAVARRR